MKKIVLAALAMVAMVACSKEETVGSYQEAIGFNNAFVENSTRSEFDPSYTTESLQDPGFEVHGYVTVDNSTAKLFDATKVSGAGWTYEGTQYWISGANYDFYAIAPASGATVTSSAASTTLEFTNTGKVDLLYDEVVDRVGANSGNAKVAFTFRHLLSKVKFSFTNKYDATNSTIRVRNITITDAHSTGNVTLNGEEGATPVWRDQSNATPLKLEFGNAAEASATAEEIIAQQTEMESYNELLLIPAGTTDAPASYNVTFVVDLLISGTVVTTYNHTATLSFAPVAGYAYDIAAEITAENINPDPDAKQEPIEFTVTAIDEWKDPANNPSI